VDELYTSDFSCHSIDGEIWQGPKAVKDRVRTIRNAFPDWTETVKDIIAEGNRVVTRFVSTGTHRQSILGIEPTGRRIRIAEAAIYRIGDGRIAEQWLFHDATGLRRQLTGEVTD
jgi:predicted ester cyclase